MSDYLEAAIALAVALALVARLALACRRRELAHQLEKNNE